MQWTNETKRKGEEQLLNGRQISNSCTGPSNQRRNLLDNYSRDFHFSAALAARLLKCWNFTWRTASPEIIKNYWLTCKQAAHTTTPASSIQPRSSEIILLFFCHRPHASWANVWCPLCCVVVAVSCILYPESCLSAVRVCPCSGKLIRMPELQHRRHHHPKRLTLTLVYWFHNAAGKHSRKYERMSIQPEKHVNTDTCRVTLMSSHYYIPGVTSIHKLITLRKRWLTYRHRHRLKGNVIKFQSNLKGIAHPPRTPAGYGSWSSESEQEKQGATPKWNEQAEDKCLIIITLP